MAEANSAPRRALTVVDTDYRRELHHLALDVADVLDRLEAGDDLLEADWQIEGAGSLLRVAADRLDQIIYSLDHYGRATVPAPISLTHAEVDRAA